MSDAQVANLLHAFDILAWPLTVLIVAFAFRSPVAQVVAGLRSVSIKADGKELQLTLKEASLTLSSLASETTDGLHDEHFALFHAIREGSGSRKVKYFFPDFERGTPQHGLLQSLRDRKLIRPAERGKWRKDKHPVITNFAQIILRLDDKFVPLPAVRDAYKKTGTKPDAKAGR